MATLLSFLANSMNIEVERFGLAVTTSLSRWNEAQAIVEGLHDRGYQLKTRHLHPFERNVRLHGTELSRIAANRLGAYNGRARGPTVSEFYRSRHGIVLRYPSAPCLMEPGGNGHRDLFPIEVIRVVSPDRISAPRRLATHPLPRPRPSHFRLFERLPHSAMPGHLFVNLSTDDVPIGEPGIVRRLSRGQTLTIHGPITLRVYPALSLFVLCCFWRHLSHLPINCHTTFANNNLVPSQQFTSTQFFLIHPPPYYTIQCSPKLV
ncbi:hypothetical protein niasHT_031208 [Heterodera trifolii]|uniref:Uncharacterized protein n=1 Tax=Heterodera trifolii TaxID=157864 RepID=A0ABD2HWN9_9BILA